MILKNKKYILLIILLIYAILVFSHSFFPSNTLNKVVSSKIFFAQFYAFPYLVGTIVSIISIIMIIFSTYKRHVPYLKNITALIWTALLLVSIVFIFLGVDNKKINTKLSEDGTLKLVEWNVANTISKENIYKIFGQFDADIAVFPELEGYTKGDMSGKRLEDLFKQVHLNFEKYDVFVSRPTEGAIAPVTIVVKKDFSMYHSDEKNFLSTMFGTVYLESKKDHIPDIIGIHTAPPLPGLMFSWKRDLEVIAYDISKNNPDAIIVGNFNATTRHSSMNDIKTHEDALNYISPLKRGTWNVKIPGIFKTTIDHIMLPKGKYNVKNVEVKDLKNSDHMCVFAEIQKVKE